MKVLILTVNIGEKYKKIYSECVETHKEYAKKWGYDHILIEDQQLKNISFEKYRGVKEAFNKGYDWVLHIDSDAIVNNMDIPVTYYTEECPLDRDYVIMRECPLNEHCGLFGCLNTGVFFIRNTQWSREFVKFLINFSEDNHDENNQSTHKFKFKIIEQDFINQIYNQIHFKVYVHDWDRQYSINGMLSFKAKTFHRDDFIIHFITTNDLPDLVIKYMSVIKSPKEEFSFRFTSSEYYKYWKIANDMEPVGDVWPYHKFN